MNISSQVYSPVRGAIKEMNYSAYDTMSPPHQLQGIDGFVKRDKSDMVNSMSPAARSFDVGSR